jgi:hypothetical protein
MFGMKALSFVGAFSVVALMARPAAAEVRVTIDPGGRVTVSASNATVGQILAEWARVGQTKIVNPERAGGAVLTIELTNVPEVEAIEVILRSAGGYVLAPRRAEMANASLYDRILILPQSSPASAARPAAATLPQPRQGVPTPPRPFAPPPPGQIAVPQPAQDDNDDPADRPAGAAIPAVRPPVFNTFPQAAPQRTDPPAPPAPTSNVTMPVGVAVPGMVVPTPQPAGQPGGAPQPPQQPR